MTIRRALFLGGAVLVLAACSDSTAPMATAKRMDKVSFTTQGPTVGPRTMTTTETSTCRGGYVVGSGRDSTQVASDSTSSCQTSY